MSAFLSHVHYQLYEKMKYQEKLNEGLASLIHQKDKQLDTQSQMVLPSGNLEDSIDLSQIHNWLQQHIQQLELRYSNLMETLKKEMLTKEALTLFYKEGCLLTKHTELNDCIQVFQCMQPFMLDGMPCDRGLVIVEKRKDELTFVIHQDVHLKIDDFKLYSQLRLAWFQGIVANHGFTIYALNNHTYTIKQEVNLCIK